jgi:hypothetical protein
MADKSYPRPLAGGAGDRDDLAGARVGLDYRLSACPVEGETYRVHVRRDGQESRWAPEPWPSRVSWPPWLHVTVVRDAVGDLVEETCTVNIQMWCGAFAEIIAVRPRGVGWYLHDGTSDKRTLWRRAISPRSPP